MKAKQIIAVTAAAILFSGLTACSNQSSAPTATEGEGAHTSVEDREVYKSIKDLKGKRIGIQPGTNMNILVEENIEDVEFRNYTTYKDLTEALLDNRIDAFPGDDAVIDSIVAQNEHIGIVPEYLERFEFGFVFSKTDEGDKLAEQMNEYFKSISESGELLSIRNKWIGEDEELKVVKNYKNLPATNGTLKFLTEGDYEPFTYFKNGQLVGIDIELAIGFCEAYGYGIEMDVETFSQIIPKIQNSEYDFAAAGISITEEREKLVSFSDPYYEGGTALAVYKP